jgi:hypothetical protein
MTGTLVCREENTDCTRLVTASPLLSAQSFVMSLVDHHLFFAYHLAMQLVWDKNSGVKNSVAASRHPWGGIFRLMAMSSSARSRQHDFFSETRCRRLSSSRNTCAYWLAVPDVRAIGRCILLHRREDSCRPVAKCRQTHDSVAPSEQRLASAAVLRNRSTRSGHR